MPTRVYGTSKTVGNTMTRRKTILAPGVDIALKHYFQGESSQPAGYSLMFVLWDHSEQGASWFDENRGIIVDHLDNLHIHTGYQDALDLLVIDPRFDSFQTIDFQALLTPEFVELRVCHLLLSEECDVHHLLFVRRAGDDYLLNGGLFATGWDEALPATWAEAEAEGVLEDSDSPWFEARVPAQSFEVAYAAAVERLRRENLEEKAYKPGAQSWLSRIDGEFT
jgi:hypothetical protein